MHGAFPAVAILAFLAGAHASAVDLDPTSFEKQVVSSGKNAFIKFFAPWCGHCKSMKPNWDKLGAAYSGHAKVVIGDVDCTLDANKDLCAEYGVQVHG
jgi:protein disulfide-isomerase A6